MHTTISGYCNPPLQLSIPSLLKLGYLVLSPPRSHLVTFSSPLPQVPQRKEFFTKSKLPILELSHIW